MKCPRCQNENPKPQKFCGECGTTLQRIDRSIQPASYPELQRSLSDGLAREAATGEIEAVDFWGTTLHFHRPLSQYFGDVTRHGFVVDALMEPKPSEEAVAQHPDWQHHRRIPSFIVIRAVRS